MDNIHPAKGALSIVTDNEFLICLVRLLVLPYVFFAADHYFKKGGGIRQFVLSTAPTKRTDELRRLLQSARSYFVTAAIFSLAINLLYLAGPLYMLQVYDRVIASASQLTLVMLTIALLIAFVALAGLDAVRARVSDPRQRTPRPENRRAV